MAEVFGATRPARMEALAEEAWQSGAQAEAEAAEVAAQARVGERIAVYLRDCASWRLATIGSYSDAKKSHRIDIHMAAEVGVGAGKRKWLRLHEERWVLASALALNEEEPPEAQPQPAPSRPPPRQAAVIAAVRARESDRHEDDREEDEDQESDQQSDQGEWSSVADGRQASGEPGEAGVDSSDGDESGQRLQKKKTARRKRARGADEGPVHVVVPRPAKPPPKPMIEMTVRELIHERKQGVPTSSALARAGRRRVAAGNGTGDGAGGGAGADGSASGATESDGTGGPARGSSAGRGGGDHLAAWEEEQMRLEDEAQMEHGPMLEGDVPTASAAFAPQLRFDASGRIIVDQETLQVTANRAARAVVAGQVEEESGLGVTSSAYMHRAPSTAWALADTYSFFEALRLHGTDFTLIAAKFPDRNRRQIKNKFKREEKERPQVVCVCVRVRVCARVCVCVRARVCARACVR
eukprot:scaffold4028_cov122-Isochrysis_galbana.AAC.2